MQKSIPDKPAPNRIILFLDGECLFCQKSALLVHKLDTKNRIYFAPLQGETAALLPQEWRLISQKSGAVVLSEDINGDFMFWRGADAVLRTLRIIGGIWTIFWPLRFLPKWLTGGIYSLIARNRYRIAGRKESCSLPDAEFSNKMLP